MAKHLFFLFFFFFWDLFGQTWRSASLSWKFWFLKLLVCWRLGIWNLKLSPLVHGDHQKMFAKAMLVYYELLKLHPAHEVQLDCRWNFFGFWAVSLKPLLCHVFRQRILQFLQVDVSWQLEVTVVATVCSDVGSTGVSARAICTVATVLFVDKQLSKSTA